MFGFVALIIAPIAYAQSGADNYRFPDDHLQHSKAPVELWNLWLILETEDDNILGLQLRLGRLTLIDPADKGNDSLWAFNTVYVLSAAVTDSSSGSFYPQQSTARDALNLAGSSGNGKQLWINQHTLTVDASDRCNLALSLSLQNLQPPVHLNVESTGCPVLTTGDAMTFSRGFNQHVQLVNGNWSGTRLVGGQGWLERTWGEFADAQTVALPGTGGTDQQAPVVIDQLRVFLAADQLLVVTRTRRRDGSGTPVLSAIRLSATDDAVASATDIDYQTLQLKDSASWQSINSGENYSAAWELDWDSETISITPTAADQELAIGGQHRWSGLASISSATGKAQWAFIDLSPLSAVQNQ